MALSDRNLPLSAAVATTWGANQNPLFSQQGADDELEQRRKQLMQNQTMNPMGGFTNPFQRIAQASFAPALALFK